MTYSPGPTGSAPPKTKISGYKQYQLPQFTPQQQQLFETLGGGLNQGVGPGIDWLSKLAAGDESTYQALEAPAMRQFEETIGGLGNRFGGLGAQNSSYFENALAGEGRKLSENLQAQRYDIRQNALNQLLGESSKLLEQRPYESVYKKKKTPWDWIREIVELYQGTEKSGDLDKLLKALGLGGGGGSPGIGQAGASAVSTLGF